MARKNTRKRKSHTPFGDLKLLLIVLLLAFFSGAVTVVLDGWFGIYFVLCPGIPHISATFVLAAMPLFLFITIAIAVAQRKHVTLDKKDQYRLFLLVLYMAVSLVVWTVLVYAVFLQGQQFCPSPVIAQYPQGILQCYKVGSSWSCWTKQ